MTIMRNNDSDVAIKDGMFMVVDFETTGLFEKSKPDKKVGVVEASWVLCSLQQGIVDYGFSLIDEGMDIEQGAEYTHRISKEMLSGSPSWDEYKDEMLKDNVVYVAHNAQFDSRFLDTGTDWLCSLNLVRKAYKTYTCHKNEFMFRNLELVDKIPRDIKENMVLKFAPKKIVDLIVKSGNSPSDYFDSVMMHRALPDAIVTATVLLHVLELVVDNGDEDLTVNDLIWNINRPKLMDTCPLPKYKGQPWENTDESYLMWILNGNGVDVNNWDRELAFTANVHLNLKRREDRLDDWYVDRADIVEYVEEYMEGVA